MRHLLLALACGCTVADPKSASAPDESEVSSLSVIAACPTGQWCIETPSATTSEMILYAVWAIDASDVFAVGNDGTILRRQDNTNWVAMASGTTVNLRSVWASSGSDAWAGGPSGTLLHFDGTRWSSVGAPMSTVDSIWGSSSRDVWFIGSTMALHWNGATFSTFALTGTLTSVSGTAPNDVWVSGEGTSLRHYNGTSWSTVTTGIGNNLPAVFARTSNDVWLTGFVSGKETAHFNGTKWLPFKTGSAYFKSVSGEAANDIWAVGNSKVGHWTGGTTWAIEEPFGDADLWSVSTAAGELWIVGDGGLIAHRAL